MKNLTLILQTTTFLGIVIGYVFFSKSTDKNLKYYLHFLLIIYILDYFLEKLIDVKNGNYVKFIYIIIRPFELWLIFNLLGKNFKPKERKVFFLSLFIFSCFAIYQIIFNLKDSSSVTDTLLLFFLISIVIILLYFKNILNNDFQTPLQFRPEFFISLGLLFFFLGNIIATGFYHKIYKNSPSIAVSLYKLNYIFGILKNIFIAYAFYLSSKNK